MTAPAIPVSTPAITPASEAHDEPSTLAGADNSIAEASKALRSGTKPLPVAATPTETPTTEKVVPVTPDAGERPRNPDGTFAPVVADPAADVEGADLAIEAVDPAVDTKPVEPKLYKLAGETQRGEEDIELDISDLPPEVVERLERLESRGMRRGEFDKAMSKVSAAEAELAEFETQLRMDPTGVILQKTAPETQMALGMRIILEHWSTFAPEIERLWVDEPARLRALSEFREGSRSLSTKVETQIAVNRAVVGIRRAIDMTIPDGVDTADAREYRAAANARLADLSDQGQPLTPDKVAEYLAPLAARYGFHATGETPPATPPARPKLAVYRPAQPGTAVQNGTQTEIQPVAQRQGVPTVDSMSPARFTETVQQKTAARAVAPQGAGVTQVRRPAPPENASIEEASAFLRGSKSRR